MFEIAMTLLAELVTLLPSLLGLWLLFDLIGSLLLGGR